MDELKTGQQVVISRQWAVRSLQASTARPCLDGLFVLFSFSMFVQCASAACVQPSWVEHVAVPAAFTLFGAMLGFAAARLNVWWDSRTQTSNFLKGIAFELQALKQVLQRHKALTDEAVADFANPNQKKEVVHFTERLGMVFFNTQIGRLPKISDERIFTIIKLYNDIAAAQSFCDNLTSISYELAHEAADFASPKAENYFGGMGHLSQMIKLISADLDDVVRRIR